MRIAYLDCFAGISGDMFLGALLSAGVPATVFDKAIAALALNASLKIETVNRSGLSATKVLVLEDGLPAEEPMHSHPSADSAHEPSQHHHHADDASTPERPHQHQHSHGRSLMKIRSLLESAELSDAVKHMAIRTFELLGESEARIHNVPVEDIHFHEVGAVDAIVDIVAVCAGIDYLQIDAWHASPLNVGGGMMQCAHGLFPVPAPATADLLRGFPTYSAHMQMELATPTGAALLRMMNPAFGPQPPMRATAIGYGAGTRNPDGFPNVLRLSLGEDVRTQKKDESEEVTVIETALDDSSPQLIAYVMEQALAAGALDVMLTPVMMKKGRPGTLLTVLCNPSESSVFEQLILSETSTLGVRIRKDRRICLQRSHTSVDTPYGTIRLKVGTQHGEERNVAPEFEDCRAAAARHHVPLKRVQQAAIAAYQHRPE
ncbi:nickel pincer cofactor biosynthesis protein LarC [Acidipila sp. 4G-K13]|uniref:Putative nickel insertion protein n=2 Tax=Paracidobacterium acidisoli TaxID=2303751 RepID=A0A372IP93_9BACT|nr:nickel pincer cofactor biosynthesis protein LarC [Paracidobacterium acidisoli]MBT9332062.1 nickel pincer cofactor biosynthesis protein LarC [Paracidobacterium acidisoli]